MFECIKLSDYGISDTLFKDRFSLSCDIEHYVTDGMCFVEEHNFDEVIMWLKGWNSARQPLEKMETIKYYFSNDEKIQCIKYLRQFYPDETLKQLKDRMEKYWYQGYGERWHNEKYAYPAGIIDALSHYSEAQVNSMKNQNDDSLCAEVYARFGVPRIALRYYFDKEGKCNG